MLLLSAEDEASPVVDEVKGKVGELGTEASSGLAGTGREAAKTTSNLRSMSSGLAGLAVLFRLTGNTGMAQMALVAASVLRVGSAIRKVQAMGGVGAGLRGGGFMAALGGPAGLAILGGVAAIGITAALLSRMGKDGGRQTTVVQVSVDARGTVTEHRALADEIAKQVEASVSTRSRFAGSD